MNIVKAMLMLTLPLSAAVSAQSLFITPADFTISKSCNAYDSIKKENNPTLLQVGKSYLSVGENKPRGATHTYIEVGGKKKWVMLSCGSYGDEKPGFKGSSLSQSPNSQNANSQNTNKSEQQNSTACLGFFDTEANPVKTRTGVRDITPAAPALNHFDKEVMNFCGAPGKTTTAEDFKSLMRANPDVLKNLFAFTGGKIFQQKSAHTDINYYLNDLADAWYSLHGFDHIFCGEKDGRSIGGLHFHGRYQQLQNSKHLCRMNNYNSNEVIEGSVYSMGVEMRLTNNQVIRHSIKGYGLTLNASDILLSATKAFSENHTSNNTSQACLLNLNDSGMHYDIVFVRRNNGIRTYYPDATPDKNNPCRNELAL